MRNWNLKILEKVYNPWVIRIIHANISPTPSPLAEVTLHNSTVSHAHDGEWHERLKLKEVELPPFQNCKFIDSQQRQCACILKKESKEKVLDRKNSSKSAPTFPHSHSGCRITIGNEIRYRDVMHRHVLSLSLSVFMYEANFVRKFHHCAATKPKRSK